MKDIIKTKIAGISFCQQNIPDDIKQGDELSLVREANPHDSNAIKVLTKAGKKIGYIQRTLAFDLAPIIHAGIAVKCFVMAITGEAYSTKGINIEIIIGRLVA